MKYLFTFIITVLICKSSVSQNAEAIKGWLNSVEKEFKEIDQTSSRLTVSSRDLINKQVRFNLLSDTYFIPVFGKPFDELSASKIKNIDKKIHGFRQKKKFGTRHEPKHIWAFRLDGYIGSALNERQYSAAIKEVQTIRRIKKEYALTVQKLKSGAFDLSNLSKEKKQVNFKYSKLFPKEIDYIKSLIDEQEKSTANKEVRSIIEKLNNLENDFSALRKVEQLKIKNTNAYAKADRNIQQNYDEQVEHKISQILSIATAKEIGNLSSMSSNDLNKFHASFNKKYTTYSYRKEVRLVNDQIYETKKEKVLSEFDAIVLKINGSKNYGDLNAIQNIYLSFLYQFNDKKINDLSEKISIRRSEIKNENELRVIAQRQFQETAEGEDMVLNTDGLYLAEVFDNIFRGHFENIDMKREDAISFAIFSEYLRAYGRQCAEYLPDNKVDIMDLVCSKENVTTNGWGVETNRVCIDWKSVRSGLYAKPYLYNAKMVLESIQRKNALQNGIDFITNSNAVGNSLDLMHKAKGLQKDLLKIFSLNSCTSTSIKRFEENIKRFSLKETSIRMQGISQYTQMRKSGGPTGAQDLKKLTDDLVTDQAETWAYNKYKTNSIKDISVRKGNDEKPVMLSASYNYGNPFLGAKSGLITVSFKNGLPDCIYFSDFPENCKNPSPKIVLSYAKGDYRLE